MRSKPPLPPPPPSLQICVLPPFRFVCNSRCEYSTHSTDRQLFGFNLPIDKFATRLFQRGLFERYKRKSSIKMKIFYVIVEAVCNWFFRSSWDKREIIACNQVLKPFAIPNILCKLWLFFRVFLLLLPRSFPIHNNSIIISDYIPDLWSSMFGFDGNLNRLCAQIIVHLAFNSLVLLRPHR